MIIYSWTENILKRNVQTASSHANFLKFCKGLHCCLCIHSNVVPTVNMFQVFRFMNSKCYSKYYNTSFFRDSLWDHRKHCFRKTINEHFWLNVYIYKYHICDIVRLKSLIFIINFPFHNNKVDDVRIELRHFIMI